MKEDLVTYYNELDGFAKEQIDKAIINHIHSKRASKTYCLKACPKCGCLNPKWKSGGRTNSNKQMLKCPECGKRTCVDYGQLTAHSHQDESAWDILIKDTFDEVSVEETAAKLNISTYTVWRMQHKLLHFLEFLEKDTLVANEIEIDETYVLNSHKGEKIENTKARKRGGVASKRGLSNEQVCIVTAVQRGAHSIAQVTNMGNPTAQDILKISNNIQSNSMVWVDGKTSYDNLIKYRQCEARVMETYKSYTTIDHLNNVNAFHTLIQKRYKRYGGVATKYLNRYLALFVNIRRYAGCDLQEILLFIKKRMRQHTDFFRIVDMKTTDLFYYTTGNSPFC